MITVGKAKHHLPEDVAQLLTCDGKDCNLWLLGCQLICPLVEVWVAGIDPLLSQVRGKLLGSLLGICHALHQGSVEGTRIKGVAVPAEHARAHILTGLGGGTFKTALLIVIGYDNE